MEKNITERISYLIDWQLDLLDLYFKTNNKEYKEKANVLTQIVNEYLKFD